MIDWVLNGLPLHVLFVHVMVVLVPLAALCVVLSAFWPAARRRLGVVTPIVAAAALTGVPFTVAAGQWLRERVAATPQVEQHAALGMTLLPWAIAVFVVAVANWIVTRFVTIVDRRARLAMTLTLDAASLVVVAGSVVTVVLIGESGTAAVWGGRF